MLNMDLYCAACRLQQLRSRNRKALIFENLQFSRNSEVVVVDCFVLCSTWQVWSVN